jgi:hypothetical protein
MAYDSLETNFVDHDFSRDTFATRLGEKTIREIVSAENQVDIFPEENEWAGFPPPEFLNFCKDFPRASFDGVPESPRYLKSPTFLIAQAHRVWLTASLIDKRIRVCTQLKECDSSSLGGLGSCRIIFG